MKLRPSDCIGPETAIARGAKQAYSCYGRRMNNAVSSFVLGTLWVWCLASCDSGLDLRYAASPWPATHTSLAVLLSDVGEPLGAPKVFGPGEPMELSMPEAAIQLVVFTYEDPDGDLTRCGATFGGGLTAVPQATLAFGANNPLDAAELELVPLSIPPPLALRFAQCEPTTPTPCPTLRLTTYPVVGAEDSSLHALVTHRGEVLVSGWNGVSPAASQLYRLEGEVVVPMPLPEPVGNRRDGMRTMASDGESLWVTQSNAAFRLDADLRVASSTRAEFFIQRLGAEPNGGPVMATGNSDGMGGATDITGQLLGLSAFASAAVMLGPERRFLLLTNAIRKWGEGAWQLDHSFDPEQTYMTIGGDQALVAAGTDVGDLLIRDELTGTWQLHPHPAGRVPVLRVILHMGSGRVLAAGSRGFIGLWDQDRWCNTELQVHANSMLAGVVHDGAAYLSTGQLDAVSGDAPLLVKVEVMP